MRPSIKILLVLTLSLGACAPPDPPRAICFSEPATDEPCKTHINQAWLATSPPPGTDDALGIILDTYDYHGILPAIYWYDGSRLNCPGHPDNWLSTEGSAACADGQLYSDTNELAVSNWGGGYPIHLLSLGHELCHWWALKTTGDGDAGHTGLCRGEGSGGIIDLADTNLTKAGY